VAVDGLVIRAESDPARLASAVRAEVASIDKTLPIFNLKPMERVIGERMSPKRLVTGMTLVFALVALLLAAIGMYAVMSYAVSQRTHEIGIRVALGASAADIFRLVIGQGLALTLAGIAIGLAGAFGVTRALSGLLYGVSSTDALTFIGLSLVLGIVAMMACYLPARKASSVDPMIALRHQ
jgi:putative ABC transport system permease protein